MDEQKTTLEIIAPSVEEAIEQGLDQLGLPRDAVKVDIIDEGKGGFLGMGNRQVRVRLSIIDDSSQNEKEHQAPDLERIHTSIEFKETSLEKLYKK